MSIECPLCGEVIVGETPFAAINRLYTHLRLKHHKERDVLSCPLCGEKFDDPRKFKRHFATRHSSECENDPTDGCVKACALLLLHYKLRAKSGVPACLKILMKRAGEREDDILDDLLDGDEEGENEREIPSVEEIVEELLT